MTTWTKAEIDEFDELIELCESVEQMERIHGRLHMKKFVDAHGKEKCDAMFAHLTKKRKRA